MVYTGRDWCDLIMILYPKINKKEKKKEKEWNFFVCDFISEKIKKFKNIEKLANFCGIKIISFQEVDFKIKFENYCSISIFFFFIKWNLHRKILHLLCV